MDRPYSEAQDAKYPPRYTPSSLDDDWAIGVETLGLDDATVQGLISQVNREAYHWTSAAPGESDATQSSMIGLDLFCIALRSTGKTRTLDLCFARS